ncbi:hypothetical protein ACLOJK_029979 [Asimina triloba]
MVFYDERLRQMEEKCVKDAKIGDSERRRGARRADGRFRKGCGKTGSESGRNRLTQIRIAMAEILSYRGLLLRMLRLSAPARGVREIYEIRVRREIESGKAGLVPSVRCIITNLPFCPDLLRKLTAFFALHFAGLEVKTAGPSADFQTPAAFTQSRTAQISGGQRTMPSVGLHSIRQL